jgi:hypothetical protein
MKKAIIGVVAVSAVIGAGVLRRRVGNAMREHCEQMATQCKQMATRFGSRSAAVAKT